VSLSLGQVVSWVESRIDQTHNGDADFTVAGAAEEGSLILVTRDDFAYGERKSQAWKITVEAL